MEERVGYIMKSMLSKMVKKVHRDDRGLSLVEVLCAVAILALVTGVIGSVIVISTRTYRRGISETNIQQEAQLAANNIGNIVKDACSVIYGTGDSSAPDYNGGYYFKNGDLSERVPEGGDFKKQTEGYTELSIITNDKVQYTMTYDEHNEMLLYREYDTETGNPRTDSEIMAQNIVSFAADTADFKKNKTIKLNMTVEDKDTNRQIPMEYTMTSRNGEGEGGTYVSSTDDVVIVFVEGDVVMVPGETYQIPITVSGKLREGLEWGTVTGLTPGALTLTYAEVTVPLDTTDLTGSLEIHTRDKKEDSSPKATASSNVRIRRVNQVAVSHSINREHSTGHMIETTGAEYMFSANVTGNELAKNVAYNYDSDYKTAQAVLWSWVMEIDGTELARREWTGAQNASGQWEFTPHDTGRAQFDEYIEIMSEKEDVLLPEFGLRLKKDLPAGFKLTVRATSKHALGVNKADSRYYDALSSDPKDIYYGEDVIEPRETILNSDLEIILEPQETGRVALGMKGGITDRVTFDYHNATDVRSDANPNGTTVTYDAAADEAVITLGKDEKGSGALATGDKYTFTVDALVNGVKKSTITVRVCRIDELSIEVFDNFTGKDNQLQKLPTYDFRARFNVSDGKNDATMQSAIKHLIQYKEDGTPDKSVVEKTLSSRITWELIDYNANGEIVYSDSVICMAGVGASDKGEVKGKYEKERKGYYQVVNIKPSRIEQNPDGTWFIKQLPEIDISPEADTPTGLPANYELKVTIEALHPLATVSSVTYNKTGEPYGVAEASASIKGDLTIDTPTKLVIVEPGQGTNDKTSSDKEMIVPIQVHGNAVYRMEAKISGNSSNGTKLSSYTDKDRYGNTNPYMAGNSTSAAQMRTWYMGLLIDENEKGDSNGRIQIHIDAYNSQNKVIAYTDFELGVRRVDKVDVRVVDGKKIADINKEGSKVKLEALPKGRGNSGTEFYDIQKDEKGSICRWEKKGHGEYIEPSSMEWTMLLNNDEKTEKPLSEWTEYFEDSDKIEPKVDKDKHKATVEFTLKQPLPSGTKIRAYSLHTRGNNGKNEAASDYEKYNKSGKKYGEVYGELTIGDDLMIADGFKRGKDYEFIKNIVNVEDTVFGYQDWLAQASFYRYRDLDGGTWSKYHIMDSNETPSAWANYVPMSYLFRPDKEYAIEVVSVLYNKKDKLIYWPQDVELLEPGRGWVEAGVKLWKPTQEQWKRDLPNASQYWWPYSQYEECYDKIQTIPEIKQMFKIPKSEMYFNTRENVDANTMTVNGKVTSAGSESEPIRLNGNNGDTSDYSGFIVDLEITGYEMNTDQQCFRTIVQKKSGNQWITLGYDDESVIHDQEGFTVDSANPYISIYRTGNAQGFYRVVPVILAGEKTNHKIQWRDVTDTPRSGYTDMDVLFNPEYTTTEENYHLYDYNTGKYVIYFEFYQ